MNGFSIDDFSSVAGPGPAVGNLSEENEADGNGGLADPFANVGFGFFVGVFFQPDADLVDANEFGDNRCAKNATGASNPSGVCDTGDDDD